MWIRHKHRFVSVGGIVKPRRAAALRACLAMARLCRPKTIAKAFGLDAATQPYPGP
jgi:hypothetical protein